MFAVVLIPTALVMWRGPSWEGIDLHDSSSSIADPLKKVNGKPANDLGNLGARYFDDFEQRTISYRVKRLWAGMSISFVAGNLSGLLGIGGGVFKVPALNLLCGVPIKAAAATSNFMIGVTAAASASLYYHRGEVRPVLTTTTVLGVLVGSAIGTHLNRRVRGATVRRLFAILLFAVAVQMFVRALTTGG
jgi:uncharacterized membrane protein YfcA